MGADDTRAVGADDTRAGTVPPGGPPPAASGAPLPATLGAAAQVFVQDLDAPEVAPGDGHHLLQVLRLRPGEIVVASDGRGRWRPCVLAGAAAGDRSVAVLEADGPVVATARPAPEVTVAFVPVKGERPEWAVQKLTEAGVDRIVVLRSARSVVRWEGDRAARAVDRLRRVAHEAAAQSRRAWLPEVDGVVSLDELGSLLAPVPLALAHPGGDPPSMRAPAVAVGPEGGWEASETAAGRPLVGLGPGVLRAETATVAVGLLLCALRQGLVGPSGGSPPGGPGAPDT
ncbi:MAG TPA: RsmE family RNA methyltransferase [Acidimicrobiales bacterium]|nr:RsmE family RNA methyltransferase [Acidimicrobiales bacterium]